MKQKTKKLLCVVLVGITLAYVAAIGGVLLLHPTLANAAGAFCLSTLLSAAWRYVFEKRHAATEEMHRVQFMVGELQALVEAYEETKNRELGKKLCKRTAEHRQTISKLQAATSTWVYTFSDERLDAVSEAADVFCSFVEHEQTRNFCSN